MAVSISAIATAFLGASAEAVTPQIRTDLAPTRVIPAQYQDHEGAVSPTRVTAVSRSIAAGISESFSFNGSVDLQPYRAVEPSLDLLAQVERPQYQRSSDEPERRLMVRVGLALGAAYLLFLAVWIWATRLRSRPPRH